MVQFFSLYSGWSIVAFVCVSLLYEVDGMMCVALSKHTRGVKTAFVFGQHLSKTVCKLSE